MAIPNLDYRDANMIAFIVDGVAHCYVANYSKEKIEEMNELKIPDCESGWGNQNSRFKYNCRCQCSSGCSYPAVYYNISQYKDSPHYGMNPNYEF